MSQNLFMPAPEESLFGDPRDRFTRLRSAIKAYEAEVCYPDPPGSDEEIRHRRKAVAKVAAAADVLKLLLDQKIGDGPPASFSPVVMEMALERLLMATMGRHLY